MMTLGNVIFPAFATPYVAAFLLPVAGIAALVAEVAIFRLLNRLAELNVIVAVLIMANVLSGATGFVVAGRLPDGLVQKVVGEGDQQAAAVVTGPLFLTYAILGYVLALILSVLIEYVVVRVMARRTIVRPFRSVALANVASYLTLVVVHLLYAALA